jgi:outer membrane lipoprotein carrier protein
MSLCRATSWLAVAACGWLFASAVGHGVDRSAPEIAAALQRNYDGIRDFSAEFVHTYTGGALRKQLVERGHVLIKKPGRMRWEYISPEQKVFVSDGTKMYSYLPQDKQVIVSSVPGDDSASIPALFLAGKGNLTRDFTASIIDPPKGLPGDALALKLVPKSQQKEYDWLVLAVDPARLDLRGLLTMDAQGGASAIAFSNLKENVGLTDKQFAFSMPKGVDVVSDAPRR